MAGYLLDTCVLSETRKLRPDAGVIRFLSEADATQLFLSVLTIGEFHKGIARKRLTDTAAADEIEAWARRIESDFADRIIAVDTTLARLWGELSAGSSVPVIDTLIAASGLAHGFKLITRNTKDFVATGVGLVNPWVS